MKAPYKKKWQKETDKLRKIALDCDLTEELKWGNVRTEEVVHLSCLGGEAGEDAGSAGGEVCANDLQLKPEGDVFVAGSARAATAGAVMRP